MGVVMKKGRSAVITLSRPPDMGRDRSRSNRRTAVPFLPRHLFDRKECAEHGLLAIEVELIGADEIPIDLIAQRGPTRRIGSGRETLHDFPLAGDQSVPFELPASGTS